MMESPQCPVTVEHVVVAPHELGVPARFAQQDEDDVADGGGLVLAPLSITVLRTRWRWGRRGVTFVYA
jgi:hypothetical protein